MSRYLLIPVDSTDKEIKEVTLPDGVMSDPYTDLYKRVSDPRILRNFLIKLTNADIVSNENGAVKHESGVMDGIKFDDAVIDSVNNNFKECYEPFYKLIRSYGITF